MSVVSLDPRTLGCVAYTGVEGELGVRLSGALGLRPEVDYDRTVVRVAYFGCDAVLDTADVWLDLDERVGDRAYFVVDQQIRSVVAGRFTHLEVRGVAKARLQLGRFSVPTSIHEWRDGDVRWSAPVPVALAGGRGAVSAFQQYGPEITVAVSGVLAGDRRRTHVLLEMWVATADGAPLWRDDTSLDLQGSDSFKVDLRVPLGMWRQATTISAVVRAEMTEVTAPCTLPRAEIPAAPGA